MSTDNSVVVKKFADGWWWAEVRGEVPEVGRDKKRDYLNRRCRDSVSILRSAAD